MLGWPGTLNTCQGNCQDSYAIQTVFSAGIDTDPVAVGWI